MNIFGQCCTAFFKVALVMSLGSIIANSSMLYAIPQKISFLMGTLKVAGPLGLLSLMGNPALSRDKRNDDKCFFT